MGSAHTRWGTLCGLFALGLATTSACSREPGGLDEQEDTATTARSQATLIAARALFEEGQLDAAQARLNPQDPQHAELRGQIEEELRRRAMVETFNTWSVGPAKMSRSLKRTRQVCARRGGTWLEVSQDVAACIEGHKAAIIRTRDGSIVSLIGLYSSEYIATENPGLYENEIRLLSESFGEPQSAPIGQSIWALPEDRVVTIGRGDEGDVVLIVGLASEIPDDVAALLAAVDQSLAENSSSFPTKGTHRIPVTTLSRTVCSNGEERTGRPTNDILIWEVSPTGTIRSQLESQREGEATRDFWIEGQARGRTANLRGTNSVYIFATRHVWHYELVASLSPGKDFESGRLTKVLEGSDCNITQRISTR